ncbi:MAG: chondroitinase family protein, partial [Chitinophagaceae bacterium]
MKVIRLIIFLLCFSKITAFGQRSNDICENNVPASWTTTNGDLSVSSKHFKQGRQSLQWNWNAKIADLTIQDSSFSQVANDKRSCFALWIYNENPVNDSLQFKFGINSQTSCSFSFQLNYKGWR